MKESNFLAKHQKEGHEDVKYPCKYCSYKATAKGSLKNTRRQCMNESNSLANIAALKQLKREVFKNTRWQSMNESNSLENISALKKTQSYIQTTP